MNRKEKRNLRVAPYGKIQEEHISPTRSVHIGISINGFEVLKLELQDITQHRLQFKLKKNIYHGKFQLEYKKSYYKDGRK